jgi:Uma2 family endonuclease
MPVHAARRLFTVDEFHQMASAGIFGEDDRVELLAGEIVEMTPIGSRHAACVSRLNHLLTDRLGATVIVRVQDPVMLDDRSEPQPDIAIVSPIFPPVTWVPI